ncbi:L,D-transpeptidase family protein [Alphaproteobacteria bacterium KMM 3653]|uniref:L,D-transpeptidase family protein n=1 Tax=Harenicola maris TaxID=2841044 RepID=A0AAP2CRX0_9RHOB|nr:L,D-transpeptidase family protein [Harenicola maris]
MKHALRILAALALLGFGMAAYTFGMARIASGTPPQMAAAEDQADLIRVSKSNRELTLLRDDIEIARYPISLGAAPEGHKAQEGDERTPEGRYTIDWRNANSVAHLSLHISYPNADDTARAKAAGQDPGGNIMIHGLPNGWGLLGRLHTAWDWTNGCIAVTNAQMQDIWSRVPNGTPIVIEG